MRFLRRTVSALALTVALGAGAVAAVTPILFAPVAAAEDFASPEEKLKAAMAAQGMPEGTIKWASVEDNGSGGLIARGIYLDMATFKTGLTTIPLGDLEITELTFEDGYVTHMKGRFSGIQVNLTELMTAGQAMGQAAGTNPAAGQLGMGLAMGAGYIQGLGYQTLTVAMDIDQAIDLSAETMDYTAAIDVSDAFKMSFAMDLTGVSRTYLDWARTNGMKMYMDQSPEAQAEVQKMVADPNGPMAKVGFASYAMSFWDQGLMPKLEPQLAMARTQMLGANPDGSPKTSLSDDDLRAQATTMTAGGPLSADEVLPLMRAIYNFVMEPKAISISAKLDPVMTIGEMMALSNPGAGTPAPAQPVDWNSRLTLEASN